MKLDKTDLKIIELITANPEICQEEIAREVGLTQPAVCFRLKKLKRKEKHKKSCGFDIEAMGLKVVLAIGEGEIKELEKNPYLLFAFRAGNEVLAFFAAENYETAESCAKMMMRKIHEIRRIKEFEGDFGLRIKRNGKCVKNCNECEFYAVSCLGLPWTEWYRGEKFRITS